MDKLSEHIWLAGEAIFHGERAQGDVQQGVS